jgi:hypothetical protein
VHDGKGHECLIAYGSRWRRQATAELRALGLEPPPMPAAYPPAPNIS